MVRRRACGITLALVALSLSLFMPALPHGFIVDEVLLVLVSLVLIVLIEVVAASATAVVDITAASATAYAIAAAATIAAAGLGVRARRAEKLRLGGTFDTEMNRRGAGAGCWPAARVRARTDDATLFSPVVPQWAPSRNQAMRAARVAPA